MNLHDIVKNKKIALYGLSTETERVLTDWNNKYNAIGLLDGFRTEGYLYGYPILDINDVVKMDDIVIVVVARPGSCKAITKRIGDLCINNNVELFDIRGKNLLEEAKIVYDFSFVNGYTREELLECIKSVDVVSFDLFDTLVVRKVLSSSDVIELVNSRLIENGIEISDFVNKRIGAEKILSKVCAPRLTAIYEYMLEDTGVTSINADYLAELEYSTELNLLKARVDMINLLKTAKQLKKRIYITSESYYSKEQIVNILNFAFDEEYTSWIDELLVSCEYKTSKTGELFDVLKENADTDNILHIGDDIVADIESADRHGIKAFQIYSSVELLDLAGGLGLISADMSISDKIRTGMFASELFNSPFQFEDADRRINVKNSADIGYLFVAPIVLDFTKWFGNKVKNDGIENVWFGARDGYLIQKVFEKIFPDYDSVYFMTSRVSAIRAGAENVDDLKYVDEMKFSGDVSDCLRVRYGIDTIDISPEEIEDGFDNTLKYSKAILKNSKIKRKNNLKYIDLLGMKNGNIAFFDFVARGTCQMFIQRLVSNKMIGLYFMQNDTEYMEQHDLKINSFYCDEERSSSAIFDDYYILETILTSPDPSVEEFDEDGNPVFGIETRNEKNINCVMSIQDGILGYTDEYLRICPNSEQKINKRLDEIFLKLIHNIQIQDKDFLDLVVEDPFFNRMTEVSDVI